MTDHTSPDDLLLGRYLAGEITPAERAWVEAWLEEKPWRGLVLRRILQAAPPDTAGVARVEQRIVQAMARGIRPSGLTRRGFRGSRGGGRLGSWTLWQGRRPSWSWSVRPIVVAVLVVILGGIGGPIARRRFSAHENVARAHVYTTGVGQRGTMTLGDGSRVTLAPQSYLTVPGDFGTTTRTLSLTGEAYVEVTTATGVPFVVQTGAVATSVLGTAFDIHHYTTDTVVRIAVVHGRVMARSRRARATVTAGTVAHLNDSTAVVTTVRNIGAYTDWTTGQLAFMNTPVATMLVTVGRWYGYVFHLSDSTLATRRVSATFNINDSKETLQLIEQFLDVTLTFNGTAVTVQPRRSDRNSPSRRHVPTLFSVPREAGK